MFRPTSQTVVVVLSLLPLFCCALEGRVCFDEYLKLKKLLWVHDIGRLFKCLGTNLLYTALV
jgi:hypothetical protein